MVVIAKIGLPKVFKEQLNRPDRCCYKSCKDWRHEYESHIKDSQKISSKASKLEQTWWTARFIWEKLLIFLFRFILSKMLRIGTCNLLNATLPRFLSIQVLSDHSWFLFCLKAAKGEEGGGGAKTLAAKMPLSMTKIICQQPLTMSLTLQCLFFTFKCIKISFFYNLQQNH